MSWRIDMEKGFYFGRSEVAPVDEVKRRQEEKLRALIKWAYDNVRLYRRKFNEAGIKPDDVKTLDDLEKLPMTTYIDDYVKNPPPR